jgi:orotate phosphoribosyltransferase
MLTDEGVEVLMVLVVVDREEGAAESIAPFNLEYKSLILISDLVN